MKAQAFIREHAFFSFSMVVAILALGYWGLRFAEHERTIQEDRNYRLTGEIVKKGDPAACDQIVGPSIRYGSRDNQIALTQDESRDERISLTQDEARADCRAQIQARERL